MEISVPSLLRIKPKALYKIGKYLRKESMNKIALFYGEGIKDMFGEPVDISLDSSEIQVGIEKTIVNNDVQEVYSMTFDMPKDVQAIVAIGGGKVIDFCKYLAFVSRLPVISVPTSISNDGFSSPMSSLYVNGSRKSLKAKMPDGVIVDTAIIQKCPEAFIYSGIGDLMSNITAVFDWKLAARQENKPINDFAALISLNAVENFINYGNKDIRDIELLRLVSGSLVMNGTAMEIGQSSRPSSGSEHLISHAYDKVAENSTLHGLQVGVATYAISWLQEYKHDVIKKVFLDTGFIDFVAQKPLSKKDFFAAIDLAPSVKDNFYSILSEAGKIAKLKEFVQTDELMKKMVV